MVPLIKLLIQALRALVLTVRWVAPWLLRVANAMLESMVIALAVIGKSFGPAVTAMAHEWVQRAAQKGFPSDKEPYLYYGSIVVASGMLIGGWLLLAYITVWLVGRFL